MSDTLRAYYRLPDVGLSVTSANDTATEPGFFRFGEDIVCYGRVAEGHVSESADQATYDAAPRVQPQNDKLRLPFDLDQVVAALRNEEYTRGRAARGLASNAWLRSVYYLLRPLMPVFVKQALQRRAIADWKNVTFPQWPLDCTVDHLFQAIVKRLIEGCGKDSLPFLWFWPETKRGCVVITYDVETDDGQRFCPQLMDLTESYGFRASFQIVPERRYPIRHEILEEMRERGHEVNVHGLNHDGRLFADHDEFVRRAEKINAYARRLDAAGFRSPVLYRNQAWYDALQFDYDMSVPNTARLEAQRGGCCTVFPYFIGNIVELPLTTSQDYTLFHLLNDYSMDVWRRQVDALVQESGLICVLGHPDYLAEQRARTSFENYLAHLRQRAHDDGLWTARPRDVAAWWRQRNGMELVQDTDGWRIEGVGAERASVARACSSSAGVSYELN